MREALAAVAASMIHFSANCIRFLVASPGDVPTESDRGTQIVVLALASDLALCRNCLGSALQAAP